MLAGIAELETDSCGKTAFFLTQTKEVVLTLEEESRIARLGHRFTNPSARRNPLLSYYEVSRQSFSKMFNGGCK